MAYFTILAIGASAGGIPALRMLVSGLRPSISAPVLVVLHIGAHQSNLPALLSAAGPLPAKHAKDGEAITPGRIYVAPPDRHMLVTGDGRLLLTRGPKENWARPAIDPLFRSAAEYYGSNAIGVVLTGKLNDGTLGLFEIKRRGGITVVQNPEEAAYPDMPRSAVTHVEADYCVALEDMPKLLMKLVAAKKGKETAMPITDSPSDIGQAAIANGETFNRPVAITCPDCGGALRRLEAGSMIKFACHIGHTYTAEIMATAQFEDTEKLMRAAIRSLNERAEFCRQIADHNRLADPKASTAWQAAGKQSQERAYALRDLVEQDWITPEAASVEPAPA